MAVKHFSFWTPAQNSAVTLIHLPSLLLIMFLMRFFNLFTVQVFIHYSAAVFF